MEEGLARFSPETRRVGKETGGREDGVEGVGSCDLNGDLDTRLLVCTWR